MKILPVLTRSFSGEMMPTEDRPPSLIARFFRFWIKGYQKFISPALPPACRFTPTCSQYALDALGRHGAFRGSWLALRRLARCHPWNDGGDDPVP